MSSYFQRDGVTYLPRPSLPKDPLEALKVVVEEYGAASNQERNYGSTRYAHLMWSYLSDLMPLIEQRRADHRAQTMARIEEIMNGPQPRRLRAIDGGKP